MKNYYEILGIAPESTTDEIKKAYKRLSKKFHPDKNLDDGDDYFEKMFKGITEANDVLSDVEKRDEYDRNFKMNVENQLISYDNNDMHIGAKIVLEELEDEIAIEHLNRFILTVNEIDWEYVYTKSIFDLKNEDSVGKPAAFVGIISSFSKPEPVMVEGQRYTTYTVRLQDHDRQEICCFKIPYESFKDKIANYFNNHRYVVFRGTILSVMGQTGDYFFYLHAIDTKVTPEDLIKVRPEAGDQTAKKFLKMSKNGNLLQSIKSIIVEKLEIKGLNDTKLLDMGLEFMILQSISHGKINKNSMKLHSLIIGSPGVGKKLLTIAAKVLNPISEEISSIDGKITMAGLVGRAVSQGGITKSNPGYFARASSGVLCVQDFHEIKKNRKAIFALLSKTMEDGEVIDSTSAMWTHEAITSIHLDTNKKSQVDPSQNLNPFEDIDIPINILSRFDFIVDIPRDIERQFVIAYEMLKGEKTLVSYNEEKTESEWQRELRRIVAYVRTNFSKIEFSAEVSDYIIKRIKYLRIEYSEKFKDPELLADIVTRLAISLQKYVKAIACLNLRSSAKNSDVDYALDFIKYKLDFLASLNISDAKHQINVKKLTKKDRIKKILEDFPGKTVNGRAVIARFLDYPEYSVCDKTIRRTLDETGTKVGHDKWEIPKND